VLHVCCGPFCSSPLACSDQSLKCDLALKWYEVRSSPARQRSCRCRQSARRCGRRAGDYLPSTSERSTLLEDAHLCALAAAVPLRHRWRRWRLLYATARDGISLGTLYRQARLDCYDCYEHCLSGGPTRACRNLCWRAVLVRPARKVHSSVLYCFVMVPLTWSTACIACCDKQPARLGASACHFARDLPALSHCCWPAMRRRASEHRGPCVLVVRDRRGAVFGCFAAEAWRVAPRYYGTGESFVFQLQARFVGAFRAPVCASLDPVALLHLIHVVQLQCWQPVRRNARSTLFKHLQADRSCFPISQERLLARVQLSSLTVRLGCSSLLLIMRGALVRAAAHAVQSGRPSVTVSDFASARCCSATWSVQPRMLTGTVARRSRARRSGAGTRSACASCATTFSSSGARTAWRSAARRPTRSAWTATSRSAAAARARRLAARAWRAARSLRSAAWSSGAWPEAVPAAARCARGTRPAVAASGKLPSAAAGAARQEGVGPAQPVPCRQRGVQGQGRAHGGLERGVPGPGVCPAPLDSQPERHQCSAASRADQSV